MSGIMTGKTMTLNIDTSLISSDFIQEYTYKGMLFRLKIQVF